MEIEIKLGPVEPALAAKIFEDTALLPSAGEEQRIAMRTVYYDDPQGRLSAEKYTKSSASIVWRLRTRLSKAKEALFSTRRKTVCTP